MVRKASLGFEGSVSASVVPDFIPFLPLETILSVPLPVL